MTTKIYNKSNLDKGLDLGLDLDLNNYDYNDILNLFCLDYNFCCNDLKKAKQKVLSMHPDKSNLDKEYFLFFSGAYKILYSIYNFRLKTSETETIDYERVNTDYTVEQDINNKEILDNLKSKKDFNKWFNKLFEDVKLQDEYIDNGYDDWCKTNKETVPQLNSKSEIDSYIDNKKKQLRDTAIISHLDIKEYNNNTYCDLTNSKIDDYSSDIFSDLQFQDFKKAHTESVIPVTNSDFNPKYNNLEEARIIRQKAIIPLDNIESNRVLLDSKQEENTISSHRAFKLYKQQQAIDDANKKWWSSLQRIAR